MLRALVAVLVLGMLTSCKFVPYGVSAPYVGARPDGRRVVMPPNAPSITGQFRLVGDSGDPQRRELDHLGIDIIEEVGTPVLAVSGGTVLRAFYEPMFGHQVFVDHGAAGGGGRLVSKYRHLDSRSLRSGDRVQRGQQVGTLGTSGLMSQGYAHLHFELWQTPAKGSATPVDPHDYWLLGANRVTCFTPRLAGVAGRAKLTYPVACKAP